MKKRLFCIGLILMLAGCGQSVQNNTNGSNEAVDEKVNINPTEFETIEVIDGKAVIGELEDTGKVPEQPVEMIDVSVLLGEYFEGETERNRAGIIYNKNDGPRQGIWVGLKEPEKYLEPLTTYMQNYVDQGKVPYDAIHFYYTPFTQEELIEQTNRVADELDKIITQYESASYSISSDIDTAETIIWHNFISEEDQKKLQSLFPDIEIVFEIEGEPVPENPEDAVVWPESLVTEDPSLKGEYIFEVNEGSFYAVEVGTVAGEFFGAVDWVFPRAAEQLEVGQRVEVASTGMIQESYPGSGSAVVVTVLPTYHPKNADKAEAQVVKELVDEALLTEFPVKTISEVKYDETTDEWTVTVLNSDNEEESVFIIKD
ncbi:DUF3221 domain-containing protein [Jeotgalibacillus aurantiacus]|uniref:DUF3221 domain-containing protein n=1 Tax=Jeotgalibacillus aurantiacus TaxID=2763266 RepID=UPI001D0AB9F4|nr:DUF3221 domain-containing protein [Jeotgalibacillus aurantiacus]